MKVTFIFYKQTGSLCSSLSSAPGSCSRGLLTSVKHCATWVSATHEQEAIQKCFRSLEYMFKFIIGSRFLFARATGNQFEDSFKRDLLSVLNALNGMLVRTYDVIMPTQVSECRMSIRNAIFAINTNQSMTR